jgi:hypothetical protein
MACGESGRVLVQCRLSISGGIIREVWKAQEASLLLCGFVVHDEGWFSGCGAVEPEIDQNL